MASAMGTRSADLTTPDSTEMIAFIVMPKGKNGTGLWSYLTRITSTAARHSALRYQLANSNHQLERSDVMGI